MSGGISQLTKRFQDLMGVVKPATDDLEQFQQATDALEIDDQTGTIRRPGARRRGFGAAGTTQGQRSAVAGGDIAESMEDFFRNSSIGQALEKIVGGFAIGDMKAEDLLARILATQGSLTDPAGRLTPQRRFALEDTLQKQTDLFRRFFGSLGDPEALARALAQFRKDFPPNASGDKRTASNGTGHATSGTLGTPDEKCCGVGETLDILRKRGMIR